MRKMIPSDGLRSILGPGRTDDDLEQYLVDQQSAMIEEARRYRAIVAIVDGWLAGDTGDTGEPLPDGVFLHAINTVIGESSE